MELNIIHLGSKHKSGEEQEHESYEDCLIGPSAGKHSAHKLQEELMKNSEVVDEELTSSVTPPATAAHLTAGVKELLLLDPP